jgi:CRISPR-associated protein Cas2
MDLILAYDVDTTSPEGQRRLRRIARLCEGHGIRVQKSVFEIVADEAGLLRLLDRADRIIDPKLDSIRVYRLPAKGFDAVITLGTALVTPHRDAHIL